MSADDRILDALARIPDVGHMLGQFVRMDGALAVVNIGPNTVSIPASGFYPPATGMSVQIERRNGSLVVIGPSAQLNPIGKITGPGAPKSVVSVDGVEYTLGMQAGYVAVMDDMVEINWATGIIQGKVTEVATRDAPETAYEQPAMFKNVLVLAADSGNFWSGRWNLNDPWASTNNRGAWFYGARITSALKGANVTRAEIFLPAIQLQGNVQLNLHPHGSKPGGSPSFSSPAGIGAQGWVTLPEGFMAALVGGGGVGVTSSNGLNKFRGTNRDKLSGAMRFSGYRN